MLVFSLKKLHFACAVEADKSYKTNKSYKSYMTYTTYRIYLYAYRLLLGREDAVAAQESINGGILPPEAAVEHGGILGASALEDVVAE